MQQRYQAVITGNTIRWMVPPPVELEEGKEISVEVTIKSEDKTSMDRGNAMYNALSKLSKIKGVLSAIENPSEWQREIRKDKELIR
ncbi:MAG: hypothetical protein M0Q21_10565 [Ignavibacteriaceae bacterium]|jgi:hypothetical protein|nr:hypothetical protein [Ignavibacteriaceae bacterium]